MTEHQRKKLVPTGEVFHISVATVFIDEITELILIQKLHELSENVFGFVHCSQIFDCKNTNSNRRTIKNGCSRLNFNYFKERLVHFNGTVVFFEDELVKWVEESRVKTWSEEYKKNKRLY